MLRTILKQEILHNLYSLRFHVSLVLVLSVFIVGSVSFVKSHDAGLKKYQEVQAQFTDEMRTQAKADATSLAVNKKTYTLRPRDNGFIYDGKEKYLPNAIVFSAWNVFSFLNKSGSTNPFLNTFEELNWSFIVALILSFVALLLTFDSVSGEKESKTLALALSNSVSRGTLLFGKYLSAILTFLAMVLPGILLSVLVVLLSGRVSLGSAFILEILTFLVVAILMAAVLAAFGLLCSVVALIPARSSRKPSFPSSGPRRSRKRSRRPWTTLARTRRPAAGCGIPGILFCPNMNCGRTFSGSASKLKKASGTLIIRACSGNSKKLAC
jgi:ABC-type transport system involved in multi-copper enzyme maturation permease subunit